METPGSRRGRIANRTMADSNSILRLFKDLQAGKVSPRLRPPLRPAPATRAFAAAGAKRRQGSSSPVGLTILSVAARSASLIIVRSPVLATLIRAIWEWTKKPGVGSIASISATIRRGALGAEIFGAREIWATVSLVVGRSRMRGRRSTSSRGAGCDARVPHGQAAAALRRKDLCNA